MSEDPGSDVKKPMEPSSLLEVILIFIRSLLFKAIEYLSAFTHSLYKSRTPPISLSDMPVDVVSLIVEKLDYKEQLKLRKVSKSLRSLVDKLEPACKSITVACLGKGIGIKMNYHCVAYASEADYRALMRYDDEYDYFVIRDDFEKAAFDDLASILKNPRLQLDYFAFEFGFYDEEDRDMKKISIVLYHETGGINRRIDSTGMGQVTLLKQWKQAAVLELINCFDRFPLEYAKNFKRFRIYENKIDNDMFIRIRDFLFKLQNLEQCTLTSHRLLPLSVAIFLVLGAPVSSSTTEKIYHHFIPNSDCYLKFTMGTDDIKIVKKKRENN
ncbi:unnamed protein product [Caenorhabditis brenneri]